MPKSGSVAREHMLRPLAELREQAIQGCYWPNKKSGTVRFRQGAAEVEGSAAARSRAVATKRRRKLSSGLCGSIRIVGFGGSWLACPLLLSELL